MNCRDFDKHWNEWLDSRPTSGMGADPNLQAHASACPRCRVVSARYDVLRRAISILEPPPAPSIGSIQRLYVLAVPASGPPVHRVSPPTRPRWRPAMFVAATVFLACWLGGTGSPTRDRSEKIAVLARPSVDPPRTLEDALAEATEATIDLVREVSAPASRIGREVLDLGSESPLVSSFTLDSATGTETSVETRGSVSGAFRSVGQRFEAGVRPLSGSAIQAFRFLIGPEAEESPDARPRDDGF